MVFSDDGGEGHFFSLFASEKLSAMSGILLMVLYLLRLESEVEPSRLDLIWLSGPGRRGETVNTSPGLQRVSTTADSHCGHREDHLLSSCDMGCEHDAAQLVE